MAINRNELRFITEFFPDGTQLESPSGVHLDLSKITALVAQYRLSGHGHLDIYVVGGNAPIHCTFYRNTDGSIAKVHEIINNIKKAQQNLE